MPFALFEIHQKTTNQYGIMGHIYENALCNLAAFPGTNSHHGLFRARNSVSFHRCIIKEGQKALEGTIRSPSDYFNQLERSPLSTRAWVYQEILLAPRVVYFNPFCLFWQCCSLCASEKGEELIEPQVVSSQGLALDALFHCYPLSIIRGIATVPAL